MNDNITNYSTVTNFNELPLALTVTEAGQVLRVGRNVAYELVRSAGRPGRVSESGKLM